MRSWGKALALLIGGGVLGGCMSQVQGIQVTHTVPDAQALAYLQDTETTFNAPPHVIGAPQCVYSQSGMAGRKVQFLLVGSTSERQGNVAYDQWRVDEVRKGEGIAGPFFTVIVTSPDGAKCTPLRSKAGTPEAIVLPKIEETLTALVSLGVTYDAKSLRP